MVRIYKNILEEEFPKFIEPYIIFIQNNTPIYIAKVLKE